MAKSQSGGSAVTPVGTLDQIFCQEHGDDVLKLGWAPLYERWIQGRADCEDCREKLRRNSSPTGQLTVSPWLGVPQAQGAEHFAGHEAAHAVVAKHRGFVVNSAWVGDDQVEVAGKSTDRGGAIDFEPFTGPLVDFAAMAFAGWSADRVWLKDLGLEGNRAAELAVAYSARIDMDLLFDRNATMDVYLDGKQVADELVREHQREIRAVQDELVRHRHLGAEAITAAMDLAHRRTPPATSRANESKTGGDTTAGTPQTAPPLAGAAASTTTAGGTGMSLIDQARATLTSSNERTEYIKGALRQAQLDLETNATEVAGVSTEAQTPQEIAGVYRQAMEQVEQVMGLISQAVDTTEAYAASLHG